MPKGSKHTHTRSPTDMPCMLRWSRIIQKRWPDSLGLARHRHHSVPCYPSPLVALLELVLRDRPVNHVPQANPAKIQKARQKFRHLVNLVSVKQPIRDTCKNVLQMCDVLYAHSMPWVRACSLPSVLHATWFIENMFKSGLCKGGPGMEKRDALHCIISVRKCCFSPRTWKTNNWQPDCAPKKSKKT